MCTKQTPQPRPKLPLYGNQYCYCQLGGGAANSCIVKHFSLCVCFTWKNLHADKINWFSGYPSRTRNMQALVIFQELNEQVSGKNVGPQNIRYMQVSTISTLRNNRFHCILNNTAITLGTHSYKFP